MTQLTCADALLRYFMCIGGFLILLYVFPILLTRSTVSWLKQLLFMCPREDLRICTCGCVARHHEEDGLATEGYGSCCNCKGCIMFIHNGSYHGDNG